MKEVLRRGKHGMSASSLRSVKGKQNVGQVEVEARGLQA